MTSGQSPTKETPIHHLCQELGAHFADRAGWQVPGRFGDIQDEEAAARQRVALADSSASGKVMVEGQGAAMLLNSTWSLPDLATGRGILTESRTVYRLRDDQFFVHLEPGQESAAADALLGAVAASGDLVAITDVTHGLAELRLLGPRSPELLSRLCGLDFHSSRFPDLCAQQSSVAKTRQLILRHDLRPENGTPIMAYSLIGPRSLAVYLWQTIWEAGHDLGLGLVGQSALESLAGDD